MFDYKNIPDQELFNLMRKDNELAFSEIYNRYAVELYQFCYRKIGDSEATRALVQELFAQIWTKRKELHFKNELKAYLYQATKNCIFNYYRNVKTSERFIEQFQHYIDNVIVGEAY